MRILLLSDTHNDTNRIDAVLEQCDAVDMIIHCGDVQRDFEYLGYVAPPHLSMLAVAGNNEWYAEEPYFRAVELCGLRFYITHGYLEHVKAGYEGLLRKAREHQCQVVLFGHTHKRADENIDGIRLINPGALTYPSCSYAILTVYEGKVKTEFFEVK